MDREEWAKSLSDEARKGLEACKSGEDAVAYCKEHGIALPDDLLSSIAGGAWMDFSEAGKRYNGDSMACGANNRVNNSVNNNVNAEANFI